MSDFSPKRFEGDACTPPVWEAAGAELDTLVWKLTQVLVELMCGQSKVCKALSVYTEIR